MILDVNKFLLTPMIMLGNRNMEYDYCMQVIQSPQGYCMEFGVWEGKSINYMAKKRPDITFYGFDSFEGLNEDWMGTRMTKKFFSNNGKMPKVHKNCFLIKGKVQDTLDGFLKNNF